MGFLGSWVGKISWRRKWQSTPAVLPGKSHGLRSSVQATIHGVTKSRARLSNFTSHANKVMLKILQARRQQYVNHEFPDVQAGFRKGRGTRGQIANIRWIMEKAKEFQQNICFRFIDYAKGFDCVKVKLLIHARLFVTPWIVACTKLLRPWDFQAKSTGVGCRFLLQGIFPTQGSNPGLSHCRQKLYRLSVQVSLLNQIPGPHPQSF